MSIAIAFVLLRRLRPRGHRLEFAKIIGCKCPAPRKVCKRTIQTLTLRPLPTSKAGEIMFWANEREFCQNSESVKFLKVTSLTKSE